MPKGAEHSKTEEPAVQVSEEKALRADARRNYERLVEAARFVFAKLGSDASMEAIAREAGVGVGTLYRHFPKRIDIVEAVYRDDVEELLATAEQAKDLEPWAGVLVWLRAYVRYAQAKRGFLNELHDAFEKHPELRSDSRDRIDAATISIIEQAQRAGSVRRDVIGTDVTHLLGSMCMTSALSDEQSARLLAVIVDGLRPPDGREN